MLRLWLPVNCAYSVLLAAKTMQMTIALQFQLCNFSYPDLNNLLRF